MLKETVLLYNTSSVDKANKIKFTCVQLGIHIKEIKADQYKVPVGFLAYGTEEQKEEYIIREDIPEEFEEPMMVLCAFTGGRMNLFLDKMRKNKAPRIGLKAALTETNATWDSFALHDELLKEDAYMKNNAGQPEDSVE